MELRREAVPCPLCETLDDVEVLYHARGHRLGGVFTEAGFQRALVCERVVRCRRCGLIYVSPRVVLPDGVRAYSVAEEAHYFEGQREQRLAVARQVIRQLARCGVAPGRLLDVGCGDGLLLALAARGGWEVWGVDTSPEVLARARAEVPEAHLAAEDLVRADLPLEAFDAITLINVLEHVPHPRQVLARCAQLLRPGGVLLIHVPNAGGIRARLQGPHWRHVEPLIHLYYFRYRPLARLVAAVGLCPCGTFSLPGRSLWRRALLALTDRLGLRWHDGLGVVARRPGEIRGRGA